MRPLLAILLLLTVSISASPSHRAPATWAGLKMDGLTMDLQDPKTVEWLYFYESGDVMVTVGERGGYLAGTGYGWGIRGEWLEFYITRGKPFRRIRAVSVSKNRLVAKTGSGETVVYKIKRSKI